MNILTIEDLSKSFGGQKVIDRLKLTVPEGAVFGFIGQNGAGKTTTMKMVSGLLKADSGRITVCGESVKYGGTTANHHIGYLPDVPEFYTYMNAVEYLALCGEISGLPKEKTKNRSHELLNLVGLEGVKKRIGGYSRGMKQRLGIDMQYVSEHKKAPTGCKLAGAGGSFYWGDQVVRVLGAAVCGMVVPAGTVTSRTSLP